LIADNPTRTRAALSRLACEALGWYKADGGLSLDANSNGPTFAQHNKPFLCAVVLQFSRGKISNSRADNL
jgi:hypothetical protein